MTKGCFTLKTINDEIYAYLDGRIYSFYPKGEEQKVHRDVSNWKKRGYQVIILPLPDITKEYHATARA